MDIEPLVQQTTPESPRDFKESVRKLWALKWVKFLVGWLGLVIFLTLLLVILGGKNAAPISTTPAPEAFKKFTSAEELKKFIGTAQKDFYAPPGGLGGAPQALEAPTKMAPAQPNRYSSTNVQVQGIDEPDIVKTDGTNLFLGSQAYFIYPLRGKMMGAPAIYPVPPQPVGETQIIKAFPVENLEKLAKFDSQGELLLVGKTLIILGNETITGFDVSDPKNPKENWKLKYEGNGRLVSARSFKGKVYLVTANNLNYDNPCPMPLFSKGGQTVSIACTDIYYPTRTNAVDTTFSVVILNPSNGDKLSSTSFLASSYSSTVYMSENAVYVLYLVEPDFISLYLDFLSTSGKDLVPASFVEKLRSLQALDISPQAKMMEYGVLYQKYVSSLTPEARMKLENDFQDKFTDYTKANSRKLFTTSIAKIDADNLNFSASGQVPGTVLNQFSVDEYKGNLRLATTTGNWTPGVSFIGPGDANSTNDVYILDSKLNQIGSLVDLGLSERIYSARFVGDLGYLVTFRQTDPFYVLDLRNPRNPIKAGELKIPGFSSYLDPLENGLVVGIGQEGGKVKLSLFNVSEPQNPIEVSKYNMDEYWTEVSNNHHAFLADAKHKVFFLPGSKGGYVFSYADKSLSLKQTIPETVALRAVYINDYLYVVGTDKITVLDENTWQTVASLVL